MNFKTTLVLIVLLAVAGVALYFTSNKSAETKGTDSGAPGGGDEQRLVADVTTDKVTKLTVAPASGDRLTVEKSGGNWHLVEPVRSPAETFEVDSLVRAVVEAKSRGALESVDQSATGLSTPSYKIDFTTSDNKIHTLNVGAKTAVGGNVYVSTGDAKDVHVVPVALADQLEKPASDYRKTQLLDVASTAIKQLTVTDNQGKVTLKAEKHGEDWQILEPAKMPGEKRDIEDMGIAATSLRATEFVSEDAIADAAKYDLNHPQMTVSVATMLPSTQPAPATAPTTQPAPTTIMFGRYDDVLKKNVFASVSGSTVVAKVAASTLDKFKKKPIELRDKRAANIDPEQVSKVSFTADVAATTQPTSKPAVKREVVLQRRKEATILGPAVPTTAPTTAPTSGPATTQAAATQPAPELSKWELASDPRGEASDEKVTTLLGRFHPLRAEKYLESFPTTQAVPAGTYSIKITTEAPGGANVTEHVVRLTDRGNDQPVIGEYNGLVFEVDRSLLRDFEGEFKKGAASASPASPAGANEAPALPFGQ
jgi:hypothetical protein